MSERYLRILDEGQGEYLTVDPDGFRDATGRKSRKLASKLVTAREAIERYVADGDYVTWECNYLQRGPSILIREILRQRKKRLWVCGKFTWVAVALLVEGDCCDRADMGFFVGGPGLNKALLEGRLKIYEYSKTSCSPHDCAPGPWAPPSFPCARSTARTTSSTREQS